MKIQTVHGNDLTGQTYRQLSKTELKKIERIFNFSNRITIYGIPLIFMLWVFLTFPKIFPVSLSTTFFALKVFLLVLISPLLHELLHLLAHPLNIIDRNTTIIIRNAGFRSNISILLGKSATREMTIWITLTPFIVMTVTPFVLIFLGIELDISIGLLAAVNFGLSVQDILKSIAILKHVPKGTIIYPPQNELPHNE